MYADFSATLRSVWKNWCVMSGCVEGSSGHHNSNKCSPRSNQVATRRRGSSSPSNSTNKSLHNRWGAVAPPL